MLLGIVADLWRGTLSSILMQKVSYLNSVTKIDHIHVGVNKWNLYDQDEEDKYYSYNACAEDCAREETEVHNTS